MTIKSEFHGKCKVTTTAFFTRKDYDDGSFIIQQNIRGVLDKTIRFGPLVTTLNGLLDMGFVLTVASSKYRSKHSLNIVRGRECYKLATIRNCDMSAMHQDLTEYVRNNTEPDYKASEANERWAILKEVTKRVNESDPFEILRDKYPVIRKPVEFIGNQTLLEYVKHKLKQHKGIDYVD